MIDERLTDYLARQGWMLEWKAGGDEDALQEGRIAVWRALEKKPEATDSYLGQAATWAIRHVQRGNSLTGEQRKHGGKDTLPDPMRTRPAQLDPSLVDHDHPAPAEDHDLAAHEREIHAAVAELPDVHRKYVVARFWGELDRKEIGQALGRSPGNLATTWRTQIQPRLADSLSHLASAA